VNGVDDPLPWLARLLDVSAAEARALLVAARGDLIGQGSVAGLAHAHGWTGNEAEFLLTRTRRFLAEAGQPADPADLALLDEPPVTFTVAAGPVQTASVEGAGTAAERLVLRFPYFPVPCAHPRAAPAYDRVARAAALDAVLEVWVHPAEVHAGREARVWQVRRGGETLLAFRDAERFYLGEGRAAGTGYAVLDLLDWVTGSYPGTPTAVRFLEAAEQHPLEHVRRRAAEIRSS
jgi:hypothetical protein